MCEMCLGKFAVTFLELQGANFSEFLGFEQIAFVIEQLLQSGT